MVLYTRLSFSLGLYCQQIVEEENTDSDYDYMHLHNYQFSFSYPDWNYSMTHKNVN
jgi:hypothetical protein